MANYNVDIELAVKGNQRVERQLKKLEELVVKIGSKAKNIDLGGQIRLKGEQKLLREKIKNTLEDRKQLKISQDIARLANQRRRGLSQYEGGIFPKPDLNKEIQKRARLRSIARSTARIREQGLSKTNFQTKFELQLASQLVGIEKQITAEQQKQISAQQSLAKQRERALESARRAGGPSSPIRGSASMPGSPKALAAQRGGGGGKGLSNLALGVGFPLLFGGGAGSIAGGALGSVGGMGGQVLGSAIGAIVDQAVAGVAELGQALNPFTADVKAVTAAAGESGTAFERLVSELEEAAGKEKALEVATAQLATIIGSEGVDALKEFGDASSDLSNELSKAFTALGAALAPVLADITRATANAVERSRLVNKGTNDLRDDPRVQQIKADLSARKIGEIEAEDKIAELVRQLELEGQIKIAKQAQADLQAKIDEKTSSSIALTEQKLVIEQNGGDILNEQVQTALQNIDAEKIRLKILEAQGDQLKINLAFKEGQLLAAIRIAKIEAAEEAKRAKEQREADVAARKAARDAEQEERKRQQLATGLLDEYISQVGIVSQIRQLGKTELVQLDEQRSGLELIYAARVRQVKIATEDASLESARLETLKQKREFEIASLDRAKEQLRLAKDLAELSAGAGFDVSAPFERNMKFMGGKSVLDTGPASFEEGIDLAPLIAYEVALDRILEKYPMIGEAATAAAGLVTFGVQEMIDGTKSAEQVFADFLNSIADMLLKTAQQMIAQYIAIAIAKMFAGMGSGMSFSDFSGSMSGGNPFTPGGKMDFLLPPGRANGGSVSGGRPYTVGERGPELFVPGASGTIIPNHAMGGVNVGTINITVENTGEQLNPAAQKQLAGQVQGIVLSTLANERRSGGML